MIVNVEDRLNKNIQNHLNFIVAERVILHLQVATLLPEALFICEILVIKNIYVSKDSIWNGF